MQVLRQLLHIYTLRNAVTIGDDMGAPMHRHLITAAEWAFVSGHCYPRGRGGLVFVYVRTHNGNNLNRKWRREASPIETQILIIMSSGRNAASAVPATSCR